MGPSKMAEGFKDSKRDELVKKIEAELTCAICLDKFDDPKVLPCLHTYCRKCVESLVEISRNSSIVCPQCREEHALPEGGAGKLLTSFTFTNLVQLLEVHKADLTGSKTLLCENGLDSNPAMARCLDCDAYLCNSCLEVHKKQLATRKHTTVTLDEIKQSGDMYFPRPQYCSIHHKELLKLYCCTCSKPICGDCTYVDHRPHEYVFLSDVQDELRKQLTESLTSLKQLVETATAKKEEADTLMEKHKFNMANIHTEIDKTISKLIVDMKKRQAELHKEVDVQANPEEKTLLAEVEEAELALVRLTDNISFTERLLQTASDAEIATMTAQTVEQCKKLQVIVKLKKQEKTLMDWKVEGIQQHNESIASLNVKSLIPIPIVRAICPFDSDSDDVRAISPFDSDSDEEL